MIPTLYLTRNGLLEPLGQSQVMAYLRGLSDTYRITLVTFEKPEDWSDEARMAAARDECARLGIDWWPQRFRSGPRIVAPALGVLRLFRLSLRAVRNGDADLIHARSYLPAAVAWAVWRLTGTPFIFDMRALWPEELITAGRLRRGSVLHRAIVAVERACLHRAAAVVSLSHAAVAHLEAKYPLETQDQRIAVIPTCADLDRFVPARHRPRDRVIGCLGTLLSGWFRVDWLAAFLAAAARRDPNLRFELTTRDDPDRVRTLIGGGAGLQRRISIAPCAADGVQEAIQGQIASVMFFTGGLSKLGSSPTRMAEILGCGLPVVANGGVGDVAAVIERYRVGVLVNDATEEAIERSLDDLDQLLQDPDLSARCRRVAEELFSLQQGTDAYRDLYEYALRKRIRAPGVLA